jgi:hypothetical protein
MRNPLNSSQIYPSRPFRETAIAAVGRLVAADVVSFPHFFAGCDVFAAHFERRRRSAEY